MPKWESNSYAKIHETCGGLVRWVEAYDNPHVGYTGECLECGQERVVTEDIIPIRVDSGETVIDVVNEADIETLRELEWDETLEWYDNQKQLARVLGRDWQGEVRP